MSWLSNALAKLGGKTYCNTNCLGYSLTMRYNVVKLVAVTVMLATNALALNL